MDPLPTITLESATPEGGYTISISNRPGCVSEGDTIPEALRNLAEAIELYDEPDDDRADGKIVGGMYDGKTPAEVLQDRDDYNRIVGE